MSGCAPVCHTCGCRYGCLVEDHSGGYRIEPGPIQTDHLIKVTGMEVKWMICAECGLDGWDDKCSECGGSSGLHPGTAKYAQVLALRRRSTSPSAIDVVRRLQSGGGAVFTGSARAASLGSFFVVLGWLVVALSVIGGIVLMATTESTGYRNEHPYVVEGVTVLVGGSIQGFVLVMIGSFVQATLEFQSLIGGFFKRLKTLSL